MANEISKILDEEYEGTITLIDGEDKEIEFDQIAVIPLNEELYCILKPVTEMEGVGEDEAIVFHIALDENAETEEEAIDNGYLEIEEDDDIADEVFRIYQEALDEEGEEEGEEGEN